MSSKTIYLNRKTSEFERFFFPPFKVGEGSEIGLLSLQAYNSIPNVDSTCNTIGFISAEGEENLNRVPTGRYELSTLESKIQ